MPPHLTPDNIGCENFKSSTLLKKLNAGNFELRKEFLRYYLEAWQDLADLYLSWSISGGEITEGLFKRREKEADFFEKSSNDSNC